MKDSHESVPCFMKVSKNRAKTSFLSFFNDSSAALAQHLLPEYNNARPRGCPTPDPECIPVLAPMGAGEIRAHVTRLHGSARQPEPHLIFQGRARSDLRCGFAVPN